MTILISFLPVSNSESKCNPYWSQPSTRPYSLEYEECPVPRMTFVCTATWIINSKEWRISDRHLAYQRSLSFPMGNALHLIATYILEFCSNHYCRHAKDMITTPKIFQLGQIKDTRNNWRHTKSFQLFLEINNSSFYFLQCLLWRDQVYKLHYLVGRHLTNYIPI